MFFFAGEYSSETQVSILPHKKEFDWFPLRNLDQILKHLLIFIVTQGLASEISLLRKPNCDHWCLEHKHQTPNEARK